MVIGNNCRFTEVKESDVGEREICGPSLRVRVLLRVQKVKGRSLMCYAA
jgi:hypothetical protein